MREQPCWFSERISDDSVGILFASLFFGSAQAQEQLFDFRRDQAALYDDLAAEREREAERVYQETAGIHEIMRDITSLTEEQGDQVRAYGV